MSSLAASTNAVLGPNRSLTYSLNFEVMSRRSSELRIMGLCIGAGNLLGKTHCGVDLLVPFS